MKIRLAILETDQSYLKRAAEALGQKYEDKLEIYSFTNQELALRCLESAKIDVLLAGESFDISVQSLPSRCGFAYLVDMPEIRSVREQPAVCKFQKAELIYKQILGIFSEKSSAITGIRLDEKEGTRIIGFLSPSGGTGSSSAAAACAIRLAGRQKKVIYLNLERFGCADIYFQAEGQGDFSDIIYGLKSHKGSLPLKIESTVRQDSTGVYYFAGAKMALDMAELTLEEMKRLIDTIRLSGEYEYIILDMDFVLNQDTLGILDLCSRIALVSDGSTTANKKLERAVASLSILEQQTQKTILIRSGILYNRFSSVTSQKIVIDDIKEIGGIKRYEGCQMNVLLRQISELDVFDALA